MEDIDEIVQEFLVESYDSLDKLDADFVALEENPEDQERLANIFRTVHTVKGTSGFLDFPKLEKVAHVGENLLVPLRDGELTLNNEIVDSLLGMVDAIRQILGNVESTGGEGESDYADLIRKLERAKLPASDEASKSDIVAKADKNETAAETSAIEGGTSEPVHSCTSHENPEQNESSEQIKFESTEPADSSVSANRGAVPSQEDATPVESTAPSKSVSSLADSTVRINVDLLDQLMNLVGELVLTRNQILQHSQDSSDNAVVASSQRLNLITSELQEGVMKTRMQPIRSVWSKLPRVVRDPVNVVWKTGKGRNGRCFDRIGQDNIGGNQGSTYTYRAQFGRPWN